MQWWHAVRAPKLGAWASSCVLAAVGVVPVKVLAAIAWAECVSCMQGGITSQHVSSTRSVRATGLTARGRQGGQGR